MEGKILVTSIDAIEYIKFIGTIRYSHCGGLASHVNYLFDGHEYSQIVIDLEDADILDSTALGLLARIAIELRNNFEMRPIIFLKTGELSNIIERVFFDQVFKVILNVRKGGHDDLRELTNHEGDDNQVFQRVIDAHRHLAKLTEKNRELYRDITRTLC